MRRSLAAMSLVSVCLGAVALTAATGVLDRDGGEATAASSAAKKRNVALVANAFAGTVDVIEQRSLHRVERIDVAPDYRDCVGDAAPGDAAECVAQNQLSAEGTLILVDDVAASPDGRILYASRPSLGDVAAFRLKTERLLWRVGITGQRPDHLALSPDGARLLVSAREAHGVEVIDTRSATVVDRFPAGHRPHGNEYSEDGEHVYNGSIGHGMAANAEECRCWLTIVDAETMDVERVIEFDQGVRPFAVMPEGNRTYIQLSRLNGLVEYSLAEDRALRTLRLPLTEGATPPGPDADPRAATHHGIALNDDRTKICAAGSISDYVAIVRRRSLSVKAIIPVGDEPAWATSSVNGRYCFVPNKQSDDVSVISYREAAEVARIEVGEHPNRIRAARVRLP